MKLVTIPSRLAVLLSCIVALSIAPARAAEKPAGQTTPPPPAPAAKSIEIPATVAVVNGAKISKSELQAAFDNAVKMSGMDASKLSDDQKLAGYHKLLDDLITEKLLKAKAAAIKVTDSDVDAEIAKVKKNFPTEDAFKEQLKQANLDEAKLREQMKAGLAQTKWIKSQIEDKVKVTDADAEAFYKQNMKEFEQPDQVKASHILITVPKDASPEDIKKKEAAAQAAYDRVKKGEDFAKVANELTEDPSGKGKGGDLGLFQKGAMVPEFDAKVFSMKVGDISEPVKTQFGYHVIKLTDKKPARTMPFTEVKEQLTGYLKNQKQQVAVQEVISGLRKDAKIKNNLPEVKPPAMKIQSPTSGADAGAATPPPTKSN